jgi:hypothetical protein
MAFFKRGKDKKPADGVSDEALRANVPAPLRPALALAHRYGGQHTVTVDARSALLSELLTLITSDEALEYVPRTCGCTVDATPLFQIVRPFDSTVPL